MRRLITFATLLGAARAYYDEFFFNTAANGTCPDTPFVCSGSTNACAHDPLLRKWYCCGSGNLEDVCWSGRSVCATANGALSASLQQCSSLGTDWCCLSDREQCTQSSGQFNICWSTQTNVLANVSHAVMNATYSSLSRAHPNSKTLTFDINVFATSASSSTTSATSTSTSSSSSASSTPSISSAVSDASQSSTTPTSAKTGKETGISGGAIAGIVIGVIAGLALIIGAVIFGLRRRRRSSATDAVAWHTNQDAKSQPVQGQYDPPNDVTGFYHSAEMSGEPRAKVELPGAPPSELPADNTHAH